ncbi:MAG: hypothetical protein ACI92I_000416 [Acidimicrobiales bacterium]|jgi:hypothetical protein
MIHMSHTDLFKFIFPFLYARDWHTGRLELSRPRVALFSAMISIISLGILMAFILQTPVTYTTL